MLSAGTVLMYPLMRAKMGGIQADVKIDHVEFGLADRKPVTAEEVEKIPFEVKKLDQVPEGFELYQEVSWTRKGSIIVLILERKMEEVCFTCKVVFIQD